MNFLLCPFSDTKLTQTLDFYLGTQPPHECLHAIATVFDVAPEYLLREDAKLPAQVEAMLPRVRIKRLYEVRNFATKALSRLDPEGLSAITRVLDQAVEQGGVAGFSGEVAT